MNTLDNIYNRRSVRQFTDEDVDDEVITTLLECARWAPSGLNNQPWKFVVIRSEATIEALSNCTHYTDTVKGAKVLVAFYFDKESGYNRTKDIQSIGASIENMLLACNELGLGAVWLGEILNQEDKVNSILNAPADMELMAIIAIGHPTDEERSSTRKSLAEITYRENFENEW
jgi:nitroreductase